MISSNTYCRVRMMTSLSSRSTGMPCGDSMSVPRICNTHIPKLSLKPLEAVGRTVCRQVFRVTLISSVSFIGMLVLGGLLGLFMRDGVFVKVTTQAPLLRDPVTVQSVVWPMMPCSMTFLTRTCGSQPHGLHACFVYTLDCKSFSSCMHNLHRISPKFATPSVICLVGE